MKIILISLFCLCCFDAKAALKSSWHKPTTAALADPLDFIGPVPQPIPLKLRYGNTRDFLHYLVGLRLEMSSVRIPTDSKQTPRNLDQHISFVKDRLQSLYSAMTALYGLARVNIGDSNNYSLLDGIYRLLDPRFLKLREDFYFQSINGESQFVGNDGHFDSVQDLRSQIAEPLELLTNEFWLRVDDAIMLHWSYEFQSEELAKFWKTCQDLLQAGNAIEL